MSESGKFSFLNSSFNLSAGIAAGLNRLLPAFAVLAMSMAGPAAAQSGDAQPVTLAALADYMGRLEQGWAQFSQLSADGKVSTGRLLVQRPSFARIEYDPPNSALVIANSPRVAVFDMKSNTAPFVVPLSSTPFYFLLKDSVRIDDPGVLISHRIGAASSEVAVRSAAGGDSGFVRLIFRHDPISLAGWVYSDRFGQQTRMTFGTLIPNIQIDPEMFDIDGEVRRRKPD